eukprot:gene1353-2095_t
MTADGTGISSHTHQNLGTGGMALGTVGTYTFAACSTNTPLCGAGADGGDLRAMRIPITTNIGKQSVFATLDVSAYIMLTNGTITFAGQTLDVTQGTFKFDINVNNYKPCGSGTGYDTCTKGNTDMTGATFAFELVVAARGGKKLTQKGNTMTSDDGDMINFNSYRLQTVGSTSWSDEAADVALTTQGSAQVITYTFKVGSTITYDPVIGGSSESASLPGRDSSGDGGSGGHGGPRWRRPGAAVAETVAAVAAAAGAGIATAAVAVAAL